MKQALLTLVSLLLASAVQAQTCNPSSIQKTKPDSRYELLSGGAEVKDKKTGLIWQRCPLGMSWNGTTCAGTATPYNWENALAQAATEATNTSKPWRLPNLKELKSLVETACYGQAINETVFPATPTYIWSSSAGAYDAGNAWLVDFDYGNDRSGSKYVVLVVRLVRSQ